MNASSPVERADQSYGLAQGRTTGPRTALWTVAIGLATLTGAWIGAASAGDVEVQTETIEIIPDDDTAPAASERDAPPDVLYDPDLLPDPVRRMRWTIMETARTGDVERMRAVLAMSAVDPVVSFGEPEDPIEFWKSVSGDAHGREVLALMIEVLEAGYVRLYEGTEQEVYVWPYFYALPFDRLTPQQEVELYKIVPPHDVEAMADFGSYIFYRLGIAPDGTWKFFVAGD